jgi:nucleotide-binding universal stress UspA family protein
MFEKLLVALDGSELAENAVTYVRNLVVQLGAETYLLHVCPPEHLTNIHMHQMYINAIAEGIRQELKENRGAGPELKVYSEAIVGEPDKIILDYIKLRNINLAVLTSHGTSGLRPFAMGSIADKVVRGADIPTLLIRIKEKPSLPEKRGLIQRILVPLENVDPSKIAVPYALQMAKKLKASITLFCMVRTIYSQNFDGAGMGVSAGLGVNWDAIDKASEKAADEFLVGIENDLIKEEIETSHTVYLSVDAAFEILEMEKKTQAELVVMSTRARSPAARWVFGSTAEKVLREGNRPIMLVREKGE